MVARPDFPVFHSQPCFRKPERHSLAIRSSTNLAGFHVEKNPATQRCKLPFSIGALFLHPNRMREYQKAPLRSGSVGLFVGSGGILASSGVRC